MAVAKLKIINNTQDIKTPKEAGIRDAIGKKEKNEGEGIAKKADQERREH